VYLVLVCASTLPSVLPHVDSEVRFVSGSPEPDVSCVLVATAWTSSSECWACQMHHRASGPPGSLNWTRRDGEWEKGACLVNVAETR